MSNYTLHMSSSSHANTTRQLLLSSISMWKGWGSGRINHSTKSTELVKSEAGALTCFQVRIYLTHDPWAKNYYCDYFLKLQVYLWGLHESPTKERFWLLCRLGIFKQPQSWAEVGRQLLQHYWLESANEILSENPNVHMPNLGMCTSLQTFWPFLIRDGFAPAVEGVSAAWSMAAQKGCLCTSLQACGCWGMPVYHDVSY